jgi:copper transport protein
MAEPLFAWNDVVLEYASFLSSYAQLGAAGFWLAVARPSLRGVGDGAPEAAPLAGAARTAARFGRAGALLGVVLTVVGTAQRAAERGLSFGAAFAGGGLPNSIRAVLLVVLVALFALLAAGRARGAWPLAAAAVIALVLRNVVRGQWQMLVNPLHVLGGGLWIGTLAVLAVTVIPRALRGELAPRGRGPALSTLVARFSSLSLVAAPLLALTGLVTAWRHLKYPAALWTTPYGLALLAKLSLVAVVVGLGAYNWRRVTPTLGAESGAAVLRRSARAELAFAAVVLAASALLVSLPAPKAPGAPGAGAAPAGGAPSTGAPAPAAGH